MGCKQLEIGILIGVLKSNCNVGQPKIPTKLATITIGLKVGELLIVRYGGVIRVKISLAMVGTRWTQFCRWPGHVCALLEQPW